MKLSDKLAALEEEENRHVVGNESTAARSNTWEYGWFSPEDNVAAAVRYAISLQHEGTDNEEAQEAVQEARRVWGELTSDEDAAKGLDDFITESLTSRIIELMYGGVHVNDASLRQGIQQEIKEVLNVKADELESSPVASTSTTIPETTTASSPRRKLVLATPDKTTEADAEENLKKLEEKLASSMSELARLRALRNRGFSVKDSEYEEARNEYEKALRARINSDPSVKDTDGFVDGESQLMDTAVLAYTIATIDQQLIELEHFNISAGDTYYDKLLKEKTELHDKLIEGKSQDHIEAFENWFKSQHEAAKAEFAKRVPAKPKKGGFSDRLDEIYAPENRSKRRLLLVAGGLAVAASLAAIGINSSSESSETASTSAPTVTTTTILTPPTVPVPSDSSPSSVPTPPPSSVPPANPLAPANPEDSPQPGNTVYRGVALPGAETDSIWAHAFEAWRAFGVENPDVYQIDAAQNIRGDHWLNVGDVVSWTTEEMVTAQSIADASRAYYQSQLG